MSGAACSGQNRLSGINSRQSILTHIIQRALTWTWSPSSGKHERHPMDLEFFRGKVLKFLPFSKADAGSADRKSFASDRSFRFHHMRRPACQGIKTSLPWTGIPLRKTSKKEGAVPLAAPSFLPQRTVRTVFHPHLISLGQLGPVHQTPPGVKIVAPPVLILQVIGVLPNVAGQ